MSLLQADIWRWEYWQGGFWPYIALVIFGFLPSEIWRTVSVFIASGIDEKSEFLEWVRAVATALLAGVVANILLNPPPALASAPLWARAGAVLAGLIFYRLLGRSVIAGVIAGVVCVIIASAVYAP
ncbi:MAG: AzlD domain-containing protein [Alphaproteobacteria bacterium]|nr:AzlD domain-containing protein [Alphaproteobacteria bacterium]